MSNILNALANVDTEILAVPAANVSTLTGTGVDVSAYEGVGRVVLNTAKGTGTTPTLDGKLQDSDAVGGTYADIPGATFTQVTDAADSLQSIAVDVAAAKGFIRFIGTIAGTTPSFTLGVSFVGVKKVG